MRLERGEAQLRQRRARDRDADDVGGRGRYLHAEHQAGERGEQQRRPQQPARAGQDERGNLDAEPGDAEHADDDRRADDDRCDHCDLPRRGTPAR